MKSHQNPDRWMVSWADFLTLLFAFFVVLYASSQADRARAERVSESVRRALEQGGFTALLASVLGGTVNDLGQGNAQRKGPGGAGIVRHQGPKEGLDEGLGGAVVELRPVLSYLVQQLKDEIEAGKMHVSLQPRGLVVSFQEGAFFKSGDATVSEENMQAIAKVAQVIKTLPNPVRLEGHTDPIPIHNDRFRSNWELSAARAIAMLELFRDRFGLPEDRLSIAAYAANAPVAPNDTEEGRARNRRVDIVLLSKIGVRAEPDAEPGEEAWPPKPTVRR